MLLSIGMMVKNEEKYLEQCLQSLVPVLEQIDSELIIVDTGSTDNTVKIAKRFTDKVYHHEWTNDFSEMRNIVLSYTSGEWFFYLDGDEVLEDPKGVIDFFISNKYKKFNCAGMSMNNVLQSDNPDNFGLYHALRFFKNDDDFHFKGIIHEQPQAKGPAANIDGIITHYGYLNDDKELMEYKYQRNVELIEKVLEENPDDIYHLFQLSQSYAMYGEYKKSLDAVERSYNIARTKDLTKYMYVVIQLTKMYYHNKQYQKAIQVSKQGCKLKNGYLDLYYFKGVSQIKLGQFEKAIASFKNYLLHLEQMSRGKGIVDFSVTHVTARNEEGAYIALCELYSKMESYKEALKYAERVVTPRFVKDVIPYMVDIYIKQRQFDQLKILFEKWLGIENLGDQVIQVIEKKYLELDVEDRRIISSTFADKQTAYGIINIIRSDYYNKANTNLDVVRHLLPAIDLKDKDIYYGEFLFYLIRNEMLVTDMLIEVKNSAIAGFCKYLLHCYDEFQELLINYLENNSFWPKGIIDQEEATRIRTALLYCLLQDDKLNDIQCKRLFQSYISSGTEYIQLIYHPEIIKNMKISWTRTNADAFLLYMIAALKYDRNSPDYVRFLRLALEQDKTMKQGIEILVNDIKNEINTSVIDELEKHKNTILETIKNSINTGDLDLAKTLINEYENIVGLDARICSAKGIVLMVEGNLGEAEKVFLHGLEFEPDNADLLYNMGYLNKILGDYANAVEYYQLSKFHSENDEIRTEIDEVLQHIMEAKKELIKATTEKGAEFCRTKFPKVTVIIPAYNQKEHLKETIESVLAQDYPNLEILVGDDCSTDGTEEMMKQFAGERHVRYIRHPENLGVGHNTNFLMDNYVDTKYAMILNHDDYLIKNNYISKAVKLLYENPNLSFVWANCFIRFEENGNSKKTTFKLPKTTSGKDYFLGYETEYYPHITGILTTIFDFKKLRMSGFGKEKTFSRDTFLYLKLMLMGDVGFINDHVAVYRVHKKSISFNMPLDLDASTIKEFEELKRLVTTKRLFPNEQMDVWMERRVYGYVGWRFQMLWNLNSFKDAINLLVSIANSYPKAYKAILDQI